MVVYPANFEQKTGFDRIREMLLRNCISSLGQKQIEKTGFCLSYEELSVRLDQAEEFRQIILRGIPFPGSDYFDPTEAFNYLKLRETYLEADILHAVKLSVETILAIINILGKRKQEDVFEYPALSQLVDGLVIDPGIAGRIDSIIDEKAEVRSNASHELKRIRLSKDEMEQKAARRIHQLLSEGKSQGWIAHDVELALRNGRQVIPVAAAYKRRIRGFIHDQSATGQTVFLEPEEVFELNNQVRELEFMERQEIIRILKEFADYLRPMLPELILCYEMLGKADAVRAKARLALDMDAYRPVLNKKPSINWVNARHPLLYLSYKPLGKHVEPFTINMDDDSRILVISGPNAGGKSVCLKAFGLIQYMLQCGLLVPMTDYSECGLFRQIFIDIGDEQSLENDLSTYSSHLLNMKHFIANSDKETLFLIDEFGAGTEPRIGGAIAEAILGSLSAAKAFGVATTHYANLKIMAGKYPGMINGSMLFDTKNMKPLFKLKTGNPGSSFAFEIARAIGLPPYVLSQAEELAGMQNIDFDRQLQDLEVKKMELEQKEKELKSADLMLSALIDKYQSLRDHVEGRKTEIILQARREARKILDDSNRIIEKTIREIRESQAQQLQTREARKELETFIKEQERETRALEKPLKARKKATVAIKAGEPVRLGDKVRIKDQTSIGEVIELKGDQAVVSFGVIKLKTPVKNLENLDMSEIPEKPIRSTTKFTFDINEKAAQFNPDIDLRGFRAEEALSRLRNFIDDAILLGVKQVRILHGKGDGILRAVIRDFLQAIPEVVRFRDEHPDRGGVGITTADFRL